MEEGGGWGVAATTDLRARGLLQARDSDLFGAATLGPTTVDDSFSDSDEKENEMLVVDVAALSSVRHVGFHRAGL